ncbi:MAG: hypothetical protein PVF65_05690 [Sphingomonadales bacterium]|jgi:hypothetical protein
MARILKPILSVIVLCVVPFSAGAQEFDPLMTRVLEIAQSQNIDGWAYTQKMNVQVMDEADIEILSRFDPSKPEDEQVELISLTVNGEPEDEDSDEMDYSDMEIPSYSDLADLLEGGVELVEEDDTHAVYRILPSDNNGRNFNFGSLGIDADNVGEDLIGELVVQKADTPYVSDVRFFLDEPHGSIWLAKVNELTIGYTFAPNEEGNILANSFGLNLDLKTLLLIHVDIAIDADYSDFKFVGEGED